MSEEFSWALDSVLSCVPMMVTVRTMRNAAALCVEDVYVHLHIKVFVILMLGSPTDTFIFFKCQAPEFGP